MHNILRLAAVVVAVLLFTSSSASARHHRQSYNYQYQQSVQPYRERPYQKQYQQYYYQDQYFTKKHIAHTSRRTGRRHASTRHKRVVDASGNVASAVIVSRKTGATATVGAAYAERFQGYIDDLEENGATIKDLGGNRRGRCSPRHMHSCGKAIDVCQLRRGVVRSDCDLPSKTIMARLAADHGLFEGGLWCNSDYGHAQLGVSAPACGEQLIARANTRHHRHHRYASR